jgi:hypothetical protein
MTARSARATVIVKTMRRRLAARVALTGFITMAVTTPVYADRQSLLDRLAESRQLYESAEYDKALAVMEAIDTHEMTPALERDRALYQGFCLLALDLKAQAAARIEAAIEVDPLFQPGEDLSPRVRGFVDAVRARLRPILARQHYRIGKAFFDSRNYQQALKEFTLVQQLADQSNVAGGEPELYDVRTLAVGFADLSRHGLTAAGITPANDGSRTEPVVVPPVVISQTIPPWPRDVVVRPGQPNGILEVVVDARGNVGSVRLVSGIHPVYDLLLTSTARGWKYRPATRDGKPVAYTKRFSVNVNVR